MINTDYFKGRKVIVVGLARSGIACANLLAGLGALVKLTEKDDNAALRLAAEALEKKGVDIELGAHTRDFIKDAELMIVSPGVTDSALPLRLAKELNIPVISEIEAGYILCPAEIIAVTGSNGKTTVTTLIGKVLEKAGKKVFVCGNIGNPFCSQLGNISQEDFVCLEVSSFQLEKINTFRPRVAVILNITRNHLDRHKDMNEYLDAKKRIFMNQARDDYLVLNYDDLLLRNLSAESKAKTVYFSSADGFMNPNQAAVFAVASVLGVDKKICIKVFEEFRGLEHRMEFVGELNKVIFINDSKATTADSARWALNNIKQPVILIAGGKDKGVDYAAVLDAARGKVREAVLIGEAKEKIGMAFDGKIPFVKASSLDEALHKAVSKAHPGDCVLLSPMCASFDMFKDYEERGRVFKALVNKLKQNI